MDAINTPTDSIFNDLETIMDTEIATPFIARLDYETPITVNALMKASGLSQTALVLEVAKLGGRVGVKDGGLIRLPEPVLEEKAPSGPRGPTAKVLPRQAACRETIMALIEAGPVTAVDLLKVAEDRYVYSDILLVARNMITEGVIVETRKGRKASWSKPE